MGHARTQMIEHYIAEAGLTEQVQEAAWQIACGQSMVASALRTSHNAAGKGRSRQAYLLQAFAQLLHGFVERLGSTALPRLVLGRPQGLDRLLSVLCDVRQRIVA